jgi:UPF0042 nucleotide-binding protein
MANIHIVSFGYGHEPAPEAHLTLDLQHHFRDPHLNPTLRHMTADDQPVQDAVRNTPGITDLVHAAAAAVAAFANGPTPGDITIAAGCTGGRHRAPHFARILVNRLQHDGHTVSVHHRDIDKPVINR